MSSVERETIVFDGVCVLCSRSVAFVLAHDRSRRYRFAALQTRSGRELLERNGLDPADPVSMLLTDGTRVWTESDAILRVMSGFGGAWRLAAALRVVPRPLRDWAYRTVARNRYRWFGKRDSCIMPSPETRERFLLD
jgi:predicted DCC family thiol-disulfide oxidoreductase YuxK